MKNLSSYKTANRTSIMRSLLLIAIASFTAVAVQAQTATSIKWADNNIKTLNCTEDAVSLKLSVKAGWHINSLHVGNFAPAKVPFELIPFNSYSTKGPVIESAPGINSKIDTGVYSKSDTVFKSATTWQAPKATNVLDKLSYIPWANKIPAHPDAEFMISSNNKPLKF
ncbi:MAG: hypothetical protein AAGC65_03140 [Mucilaginibacter sp.]|uniref:hypothetical protein n=1 Tax=Mucilaginibacter sp. TaxID=1882438 RepID=UPI0031A618C5